MNIEWRTGVGYGDFVSGLGYAHSSRLKYDRSINIRFHWSHSKDYLFSDDDPETIIERCEYINSIMVPVDGLTVNHEFNSDPDFRFYNQLDEFDPLHGVWYSIIKPELVPKSVVMWTTEHNLSFPGKYKDPAYKHWEMIRCKLEMEGYTIHEITYRTPVREAINLINKCEFGIGYDGLAHQLFKFMWKPLIVFCERYWLNNILVPQAVLEKDPEKFLYSKTKDYVNRSIDRMNDIREKHLEYVNDRQRAEDKEFFNTFIYRQGRNRD